MRREKIIFHEWQFMTTFNFTVELEELERNGFGKLTKISSRGTTFIFFKLPGAMIDEEIGPHKAFLKLADIDINTYDSFFADMSKLTSDLKRLCQQHPHCDYLLAEGIL